MRTYEEAARYLEAGRSKTYRPLTGRSTSIERRDETTIAIRYHETDVVTYHKAANGNPGSVTLDSGGWHTMTTKDRMNEYSNVKVYQEKGLWYVVTDLDASRYSNWDSACLYQDEVYASEDGTVLNAPPQEEKAAVEAAKRKVDRMVRRYIKGFAAHLVEVGAIEKPSAGDCFYCVMRTVDGNVPLGDKTGNVDHLISHMQEPYYVPSLLFNAAKEQNYGGGPGILKQFDEMNLRDGRAPDFTVRALRAYFRSRKLALAEHIRDTIRVNRTPAAGPGSVDWQEQAAIEAS